MSLSPRIIELLDWFIGERKIGNRSSITEEALIEFFKARGIKIDPDGQDYQDAMKQLSDIPQKPAESKPKGKGSEHGRKNS